MMGRERGRPYRGASAAAQKYATRLHAAVFRATNGRILGRMLGGPVLLLVTVGRKTERHRTTPLLYLQDGDRYAIVASNGGTAKHPVWWLNLLANPDATAEVGGERVRVRAREATGEEKARLWRELVKMYPPYQDYQKRTDREIPVAVLEPV
jgi:deazaflavin-dependent oxidoreductase (nitroreductase family)